MSETPDGVSPRQREARARKRILQKFLSDAVEIGELKIEYQKFLIKTSSLKKKKGEEGGNLSISEVETIEMVSNIWKDFP